MMYTRIKKRFNLARIHKTIRQNENYDEQQQQQKTRNQQKFAPLILD